MFPILVGGGGLDPPLKCTVGAVAKLSQRRQSKHLQTPLMDGNV